MGHVRITEASPGSGAPPTPGRGARVAAPAASAAPAAGRDEARAEILRVAAGDLVMLGASGGLVGW